MKDLIKKGELFIWLTGLGLGISIVMIAGLLMLVFFNSTDYYYPSKIAEIKQLDNNILLGQIFQTENVPQASLPDSLKGEIIFRKQIKIGNRDIYGYDFTWIDEREIDTITYPKNAVAIERTEYGNFYGFYKSIKVGSDEKYLSEEEIEKNIDNIVDEISGIRNKISEIEKDDIGAINFKIEQARQDIEKLKYYNKNDLSKVEDEIATINENIEKYHKEYSVILSKTDSLRNYASQYILTLNTVNNRETDIPFLKIIRIYKPNDISFFSKAGFIISKLWEILSDEPRESNTEGGIFPAIFGTIMLVLIMSIFMVPFGILAALYLREYAKQGVLVRIVRIAVNNLAGVPSIVFGVFGLGFFVYFVGGTIDQLFYPERLPTPTWGTGGILWASLTLSLLTLPVVIVSTEEALASIPRSLREASLALGGTKWQTIRRVVLPSAAPGILTGMILAMARAAGEVAPLMITGVVKLAPNLPFDSYAPFFHLDRKFMHLGFHIYDVGFQSPNVEAALPMVYITTLLLIVIVVLLNLVAMITRNNLRKKYQSSTF